MVTLTKQEVAAMWLYHAEYAELKLGAVEYYRGLTPSDKKTVQRMIDEIAEAPDAD